MTFKTVPTAFRTIAEKKLFADFFQFPRQDTFAFSHCNDTVGSNLLTAHVLHVTFRLSE